MKVFLASPFSQFCNDKEDVIIENRWFFISIIEKLKNQNIDYFCSQEREEWGEKYISPTESIDIDYKAMNDATLVVAIPGNPISGGVHVELGWASSLNKKILLFLEEGIDYSPMVLGLPKLTNCEIVYYKKLISKKTVNLIIKNILKEV